jgi:hypothetical protein
MGGPVGSYQRYTAISIGSPRFDDAVSQCYNIGSQGGSGSSPGSSSQRTEISPLPRLFWVGLTSVEPLDGSTADVNMTQAHQVS